MVTSCSIKNSLFSFTVCCIALAGFTACGSKGITPDIEAQLQQPVSELTKENDRQFLTQAIEMYYGEIVLGKLAHQRATSEEVKNLAKALEEVSRKAKSELSSLAIMKSIAIPGVAPVSVDATYDMLNRSPLETFDADYLELVIQSHHGAIIQFENTSTQSRYDPDVRKKAAEMLSMLRNNLSKAVELHNQVNPATASAD